jgi:hypothetical protein
VRNCRKNSLVGSGTFSKAVNATGFPTARAENPTASQSYHKPLDNMGLFHYIFQNKDMNMDYSEAHKYLESKGCTFTYDNADKPVFSDVHVFYKGKEFGMMGLHNMAFYTDRTHKFITQFNYRTMWIYGGDEEFKKLVERYIADSNGELPSTDKLFDDVESQSLKNCIS